MLPTRSRIITGLYPARTGITAPVCHVPAVQLEKRLAAGSTTANVIQVDSLTRLKGGKVTLAEVFEDAGYRPSNSRAPHVYGDIYNLLGVPVVRHAVPLAKCTLTLRRSAG